MSNSDFMDLIIELQQQGKSFELAVQQNKIPITHSLLSRIGLRLHMPVSHLPEFVPVSHDDFTKEPPESWRLAVLELNWDIYGSSKTLVLGSVSMSQVKTDETRQLWRKALAELEHRARLLAWQPLTKKALEKLCPCHIVLRMSTARRRWCSG